MGNENSGRRPDVMKMAREQFQNNAVEFNDVPLVLPNLSGVQKEALRTDTGLTAGSVLFADTDGTIAQDNANLFWDDTNNRLGIGTTSPVTTLHVNSDITTAYGSLFVGTNTNSQTLISLNSRAYIGYDGNNLVLQSAATKAINFNVNNATFGSGTAMTISTTGNVGIGTTSPGQLLQVGDGTQVTPEIKVAGETINNVGEDITADIRVGALTYFHVNAGQNVAWKLARTRLTSDYDGRFSIYSTNRNGLAELDTERLSILGNGNVGIGTTSPDVKLSIVDATDPTLLIGETQTGGTYGIMQWVSASDYLRLTTGGSSIPLILQDVGGSVGIGTTSPSTPLHVSGSGITFNRAGNFGQYVDFLRNGTRTWQFHSGIASTDDSLFSLRGGTAPDNKFFWHISGGVSLVNHTDPTNVPIPSTASGSMFISGGQLWYKGFAGTVTQLAVS